MAIVPSERARLLAVYSIGPKMVRYFEAIGMEQLSDFAGGDAHEIALAIDVHIGANHMNANGVKAIQNVIDAASDEGQMDAPSED